MVEHWYRPDGSGPISVGQFLAEGHKWGRDGSVAQWEGEIDGKDVAVSTVFLGLDHNFGYGPSTAPLTYETMVFGGDFDGSQRRYPTAADAQRGHDEMIALIGIVQNYRQEAPEPEREAPTS